VPVPRPPHGDGREAILLTERLDPDREDEVIDLVEGVGDRPEGTAARPSAAEAGARVSDLTREELTDIVEQAMARVLSRFFPDN
jgi:hypothetical protein